MFVHVHVDVHVFVHVCACVCIDSNHTDLSVFYAESRVSIRKVGYL